MQLLSTINRNKTLITAAFSLFIGVLAIALSPVKVEAAQPISCPLRGGSGDILVNFYSGEFLFGTPAKGDVYRDYNTKIPVGKYKVTMTTYDNHSEHGGQGQENEQVYVALRNVTGATFNGIVAKTGDSKDIPENRDSITSTLSSSLDVRTATKIMTVVHAAYPGGAESVIPICVLFEKLDAPTPVDIDVTCHVSDTSVMVGDNVTWTGSATGGTGGFTYSWSGTVTGSGQTKSRSFSSAGSYVATVTARDSSGQTESRTCPTVVVREDEPNEIDVTCHVSDTSVMVGDNVTWTGSATGGTGGFTYSWSGTVTGSGQTKSRSFSSAGSYVATVTARDSSGQTESRTCPTVVVREDEPNEIDVTCHVSDTSVDAGDEVEFTVDIDGGDSPFTYDWNGDIEGEDDDNSSLRVQYDDDGTYYVTVEVEDSNGNSDSASCSSVRVSEEDEEDFDVTCRVSDTSVEVGDEVEFTVDIDGGNSPYEYEWDGDIEGEDDDTKTLRVEYDDEGNYDVEITVTDDDGNEASDDCSVVKVKDNDGGSKRVRVSSDDTPSGQLASLDSVFLNQVPETGSVDNARKIAIFMSLLAVWSLIIGVIFYQRHKKSLRSAEISRFKETNRNR